jgi:tetratricopeptide (TPR) repeat protein
LKAQPGREGGRAAASSVIMGFAAFVFLHLWTGAVPRVFETAAARGGWIPCSAIAGVLAGCFFFGRARHRPDAAPRLLDSTVLAFGLAGIPVWQLLRVAGRIQGGLEGAGVASTFMLTAVPAFVMFCIAFVPGFIFGGFLAYRAAYAAARRGPAFSGFGLWPLFLGLAAGDSILVFAMLPRLGPATSMMITAGVTTLTGLVQLMVPGRQYPAELESEPPMSGEPHPGRPYGFFLRTVYVFAVVAWFVLWFRLTRIAAGPAPQVTAALFAALFTGLTAGSIISSLGRTGRLGRIAVMGLIASATGILLLFLAHWWWRLPLVFINSLNGTPLFWADLLGAYFSIAFLTVFVPAVLFGLSVPEPSGPAGQAGRFPATEVRAVVAGLLAALIVTRFIPTPVLAPGTLLPAAAWICVGCGLIYFGAGLASYRMRLAWMVPVAVAAVVVAITQPRPSSAIMARGLYTIPLDYKRSGNIERLVSGTDLVFSEFVRDELVSVDRTPDAMTLRVNGDALSSAESGMVTSLMTGHMPLLIAKDPKRVFLGGLEAGLTLGAVETYPVEEIRCVAGSEAIARAAELFAPYNRDALADARLTLEAGDYARDLAVSANRYDVIILKSPPPYSYSSARLLGPEFLNLLRSRLGPGGIVCQQLSTFEFPVPLLKSVARSFAAYFPHVTVWWVGRDKILLLGSQDAFHFDEAEVGRRMSLPTVKADMERLATSDPDGILSCFMMRRDNLLEFASGAGEFSPDSYRFALSWPHQTLELERTAGLSALDAHGESPIVLLEGGDTASAKYKIFRDRLDKCRNARSIFIASLVSLRDGKVQEAVSKMNDAPTVCPLNGIYVHTLADYYIILSRGLTSSDISRAVDAARRAVELLPASPRTFYNLASIEITRDPETAIALADRATQLNPYYVPAYLLKAQAELTMDRPKDAAETLGQVLTMEPFNLRAHYLRGLSFTRAGMYGQGRAEFERVLAAEPDDAEAIEAMAYAYLLEGDLDRAEKLYKEVLELEPDNLGALNNYATILAEKGLYGQAVEVWTKALQVSPGDQDIIDNIKEARENMRR